jgi:hypothetical protein
MPDDILKDNDKDDIDINDTKLKDNAKSKDDTKDNAKSKDDIVKNDPFNKGIRIGSEKTINALTKELGFRNLEELKNKVKLFNQIGNAEDQDIDTLEKSADLDNKSKDLLKMKRDNVLLKKELSDYNRIKEHNERLSFEINIRDVKSVLREELNKQNCIDIDIVLEQPQLLNKIEITSEKDILIKDSKGNPTAYSISDLINEWKKAHPSLFAINSVKSIFDSGKKIDPKIKPDSNSQYQNIKVTKKNAQEIQQKRMKEYLEKSKK